MGFATFIFTVLAVVLFVLFLYGSVPPFVLYIAMASAFLAAGFGAAWASKP